MAQSHAQSLPSADSKLLETLAETAPEYPTVAASRCPVSLEEARERCERLATAGLLERVTAEPVYRVTEDGRRVVAAAEETVYSATGD
ncbi:DUF2250 domain-containing protein [Haloarcula nitratireducens]|uniref:DUF2250 domain-containing protein n=1 Tax=Haloarcula nitratireducens TaxID=2487749 RepID=A0AAW4P7L0_9EURY|nr:DUF2250 domain-containing protein [Halomicroarcula nitratireducens]MBX0293809.1 DUF2250 domain-containing protein [Halomicroarcula nitratireducens]